MTRSALFRTVLLVAVCATPLPADANEKKPASADGSTSTRAAAEAPPPGVQEEAEYAGERRRSPHTPPAREEIPYHGDPSARRRHPVDDGD